MNDKDIQENQTHPINSNASNNDLVSHLFLRIEKKLDHKDLYIGSIRKMNSTWVVVELKSEGKHLISIETIKALSNICQSEYKKSIRLNRSLPNSYLIIKKDFVSKLFIFSAIDLLLVNKKKLLIAIDGNASSGKTTFSKLLSQIYDCNIFHVDHYFQKPVSDPNDHLSNYASNINFKRMQREIFDPIQKEKDSKIHTMDLKTHTLSDEQLISYKEMSVVEGAYSMHPYIIKNYDLKILMTTTYFKQIIRIWKRNGFKKLTQFMKRWIPMENKYFHDLQIENDADIILRR